MKHPERAEDYLEHIAQAIERAMHYVQPLDSVQALEQSPLIQDALIRNLEIIGEAASQIQQHARNFSGRTLSYLGSKCAAYAIR